jgi:hypothetical protein
MHSKRPPGGGLYSKQLRYEQALRSLFHIFGFHFSHADQMTEKRLISFRGLLFETL